MKSGLLNHFFVIQYSFDFVDALWTKTAHLYNKGFCCCYFEGSSMSVLTHSIKWFQKFSVTINKCNILSTSISGLWRNVVFAKFGTVRLPSTALDRSPECERGESCERCECAGGSSSSVTVTPRHGRGRSGRTEDQLRW